MKVEDEDVRLVRGDGEEVPARCRRAERLGVQTFAFRSSATMARLPSGRHAPPPATAPTNPSGSRDRALLCGAGASGARTFPTLPSAANAKRASARGMSTAAASPHGPAPSDDATRWTASESSKT
ncbi:MAG: hypothetical protein IPJ34_41915 [Myxococcales bacterium]|nr:hypothetical protein [Myxococcales bacterium]